MCRLFAFSFTDSTDEQKRIHLLNAFRDLAVSGEVLNRSCPGHADGWGTAIYTIGTDGPVIYRSTESAHSDQRFRPEEVLTKGRPQSGVAHLRKKTVGDTSIRNTHPFVEGRYSFIHNGTVGGNTYDELAPVCLGDTDSERLFRKFLDLKEKNHLSAVDAFQQMLLETQSVYPRYSAINTVLHDGERLYVSRIINKAQANYSPEDLEKYYTLYIGETKNGDRFISSEKIPDADISYTLIPNGTMCVLDGTQGDVVCRAV